MSAILRGKSLTERAADEIRRRILTGDFQLGEPLSENTLAAEFGISKTPVREALVQLKMEGLVHIHPQRGSFVFDMTVEQIAALGELRETLEVAALDLAMQRNPADLIAALKRLLLDMEAALAAEDYVRYRELDDGFHCALFEHCGNKMMLQGYRSFASRIQALRQRLSVDPNLNGVSLSEHRAIVERLTNGDVAGAQAELRVHMACTVEKFQAAR